MDNKEATQPDFEWQFQEEKDGLKRCYANHFMLAQTGYDLRLTFGEIIDVTGAMVTVEQRAQVTLSWLEAKNLSQWLQSTIANHEEDNGLIKEPILTKPGDKKAVAALQEKTLLQ